MKILLISPWRNRWVDSMKTYFEAKGHEFQWCDTPKPIAFMRWADVAIFGWANEHAIQVTKTPETKFIPYICFLRSYEILSGLATKVDWRQIDHALFVNPKFELLARNIGVQLGDTPCTYLPNAVDLDVWKVQEHKKGNKIAFVADLSHKKGLHLLAQVFLALPDTYELHLFGNKYGQDRRFVDSFLHLLHETGAIDRVLDHGRVEDVPSELKNMDYVISTSPMEGCPMNVLEAMALGIKPIIFNWPGSRELFGDKWVFNTIQEAVELIENDDYNQSEIRDYVEQNFHPELIYSKLELIIENEIKLSVAKTGAYSEAD